MNAGHLLIAQEAERLAADCLSQQKQLEEAKTMRAVRDLADVHLKPEMRGVPEARNAVNSLHMRAAGRMGELLDEQLLALARIESVGDFLDERARLMDREWRYLRGDYAQVLQRADRESAKIRHTIEQASTQGRLAP